LGSAHRQPIGDYLQLFSTPNHASNILLFRASRRLQRCQAAVAQGIRSYHGLAALSSLISGRWVDRPAAGRPIPVRVNRPEYAGDVRATRCGTAWTLGHSTAHGNKFSTLTMLPHDYARSLPRSVHRSALGALNPTRTAMQHGRSSLCP